MLALVTCAAARGADTDLPRLLAELPEAVVVDWDDDAVDWAGFDAAVIRSTWDYATRRTEFVRWAERVDAATALWNPLELLRWNTDKRYLLDLAADGIPVPPTTIVSSHDDPARSDLDGDVVVKPTVGVGSIGVFRSRGDRMAAERHLIELLDSGRDALVQPYQTAIDEHGETGLVYLAGRFSHAFRKSAVLDGPTELDGTLMVKETTRSHRATTAERALGDDVVGRLGPTAYARVDLVPGDDGPLLLELELTEPSLFLHHDEAAPARAAAAFRSLMA